MTGDLHHAVYLPPFGELADPRTLVDLAITIEGAGWDGLFLWDHMLRPEGDPAGIADAWTTLAAIAAVTSRIRIGPMVTPLARRRPQVVARQAATVDRLSEGRLIVGLGLGVDDAGEFERFGDPTDLVTRGRVLDEGADLFSRLVGGEHVDHHGEHFTASGVSLFPTPVQRPRPPMWFGARGVRRKPLRRAARYEGLYPIGIDADDLARIGESVVAERGSLNGFDLAITALPGLRLDPYEANGATWAMWAFLPGASPIDVETFAAPGPSAYAQ